MKDLILYLYDVLISGGEISRRDFCRDNFITERTFYRYTSFISDFLQEYKPDCVLEVRREGVYSIKAAK